jgi:anti-sigma factor RsiW
MTDPITEADLHAFVDDQLSVERRLEVEDHLSRNPSVAARVMADMRARDALGLAFGRTPISRPADRVLDAARRLERGLVWRRIGLRLRRAAAVAVLVGAGWFAHAEIGLLEIKETRAASQTPSFVEDARHAHETALVRARMSSQPEATDYDPQEILAATGIALPPLPGEWRVADAQVFPGRHGYSVEIAVDAGSLGEMSFFAGRSATFNVIAPTTASSAAGTTVYWQSGELGYALTGSAPPAEVERAAARLSADLR